VYFEGKPLRVTTSIGLAKYESGSGVSIDTVFAQADAALYAAKENGRNCCAIFNSSAEEQ